jgi:hypothetical protein
MQIFQYGNPGQNYITGKKNPLQPKVKAKIFRTNTVRGITGNKNLSVW